MKFHVFLLLNIVSKLSYQPSLPTLDSLSVRLCSLVLHIYIYGMQNPERCKGISVGKEYIYNMKVKKGYPYIMGI